MKKILTLILFILLALPVGVGAADDLYAHHTTFSDADCTCEQTGTGAGPCSLSKAISCVDGASDRVIVEDGTHDDINTLTCPDVDGGSGTEIYLMAENEGLAIFTGKLRILLQGDYWVVQDFKFDGIEIYGGGSRHKVIHVYGDNFRITDNYFTNIGTALDTYNARIIEIASDQVATTGRIDNNHFVQNRALCVANLDGNYNVVIEDNDFDTIYEDSPDDCSAIHVGNTVADKDEDSLTIIQDNLFRKCQGDDETISMKNSSITVQRNTLIGCIQGVIRQGNDSSILNNFTFGSPGYTTGGWIITGDGHIIADSIIQGINLNNTRGIWFRAGDVAKGADPSGVPGNAVYPATNILAIHNTISNFKGEKQAILFGDADDHVYATADITLQNNIIENNNGATPRALIENWKGALGNGAGLDEATFTRTTNVLDDGGADRWRGFSTSDATLNTGQVIGDASLTTRDVAFFPDDMYVIQDGVSNAQSAGTYNATYPTDMDGQTRDNPSPDIGADEYDTGSITVAPLQPCEVGASWARPSCEGAVQGYEDLELWLNATGTDASPYVTHSTDEYPSSTNMTVNSTADIIAAGKVGGKSFASPNAGDYFEMSGLSISSGSLVIGTWVDFHTFNDNQRLFKLTDDAGTDYVSLRMTDGGGGAYDLTLDYVDNGGTSCYATCDGDDVLNGLFDADYNWSGDEMWIECEIDTTLNTIQCWKEAAGVRSQIITTPGCGDIAAFTITKAHVGNSGGGNAAFATDNLMISTDLSRNFCEDTHNGTEFNELTAYPAGGASVATISIPAGTYTEGQQPVMTLTWSPGIPDLTGEFYLFTKLAPLWGSYRFTSTSATSLTGEVITDGMRWGGALVVVDGAELQGGTLTYGGIPVDRDISGLSITNSPEIADPKKNWKCGPSEDSHYGSYTAFIAEMGIDVAGDRFFINGSTETITCQTDATAADPIIFMIYGLTGDVDLASKDYNMIQGVENVSGSISNPGTGYQGLYFSHPPGL